MTRRANLRKKALFGAAAFTLLVSAMPASAAEIVLKETGSTLLYPLFQLWIPAYTAIKPDVKINITATNSGEGIKSAIAGTVQIGTSDAYMSDEEAERNRLSGGDGKVCWRGGIHLPFFTSLSISPSRRRIVRDE